MIRTLKKIGLIILLIGICIGAFFVFGSYSDGYRAGTLMKFSRKGFIVKTNEGELYLGTVINSDNTDANVGVMNNIWYFSAQNDSDLIAKIEAALLNGHRVKLHYKEKYMTLFWVGNSKYVVTDIEVLDGKGK